MIGTVNKNETLKEELNVFRKEFGNLLLPYDYNDFLNFAAWKWACLRLMYMYISSCCSSVSFCLPRSSICSLENTADIEEMERYETNVEELYDTIIPNSLLECYGWDFYNISIETYIVPDENDGFHELEEFFNDPELLSALRNFKNSELVVYFNKDLHSFISKSKDNLNKFLKFAKTYSPHFGMFGYVTEDCFPKIFLITKKNIYYAFSITCDEDYDFASIDFNPETFFIARDLYELTKEGEQ